MGSTKIRNIVPALSVEAQLKRKVRSHLSDLGFARDANGLLCPPRVDKQTIRRMHSHQKSKKLEQNEEFIKKNYHLLAQALAEGRELEPEKIDLCLRPVTSGRIEAKLFRMAGLTWSVPVSNGFGRRIRYLIWDQYHDRLAGVAALGDPVFNLSVRDNEIGWDVDGRTDRLCNVLDAYVLGALPPYNQLLCGKAIACMLRSREVYSEFKYRYGKKRGLISGKKKKPKLLAFTTSSSMGRSSLYNRLRLDNENYLRAIGYTKGWGHFHVPEDLFFELREYLRSIDHPYEKRYEFGEGPNWRMRTIKAAFSALGIQQNLLHHGIQRQVFIGYFANNAKAVLNGECSSPDLTSLRSTSEILDLAKDRWIVPRAARKPEFANWKKSDTLRLFSKYLDDDLFETVMQHAN